jgi:hypothetical protein
MDVVLYTRRYRKWTAGILLGMGCLTLAGCVSDDGYYSETTTYQSPGYYRPYYDGPRYAAPRYYRPYYQPRYDQPRYDRPRYDRSRFDRNESQRPQRADRDDRRGHKVRTNDNNRDDGHDQRRFRRFWMQKDD